MALEGQLSDFGLPDIFQLISIQQKTGVLELVGPSDKASVRFQNGDITNVFATTHGNITQLLKNYLIVGEKLSKEDIDRIEETCRSSNMKFEKVLVTGRYLTTEELQEAVRLIMEETIYDLFTWKEASYSFMMETTAPAPSFPAVLIRADGLLMEGMRRIDEWPEITKLVSNSKIIFQKNPDLPVNPDTIPPDEARVYTRLDGRATVRDLIDALALGQFRTYECLANLLRADLIVEIKEAKAGKKSAGIHSQIFRFIVIFFHQLVTFIFPLIILLALFIARLAYQMFVIDSLPKNPGFIEMTSRNQEYLITQALTAYYVDTGEYPGSLKGLVDRGFISEILSKDFAKLYDYRVKKDRTSYQILAKDR